MKVLYGRKAFGFFEEMSCGIVTDKFEDLKSIHNTLKKEDIISYIESLDPAVSSERTTDMFTGEQFNASVYHDGEFTFTGDFFRYYKKYDIGIPLEYEEYLKTLIA